MRASRLVQLLMLLQARGRTTAADLASELEVSVRTVYRDVEALSAAGVPVWAESGPGGGIQLVDGYETRLTGLTGPEAEALALAGMPAAAAQLGLGTVLVAAQAKVDAALPPELRGRTGRLRGRFLVDAPGWFERVDDVPLLTDLATAVWDGRRVRLRYERGRPGATTVVTRTVDPLGLVLKGATWYLVARARRPDGLRTFRVGRITALTVLDARADPPNGFNLAIAWAQLAADFDRSMRSLPVRMRIRADALWRLRHALAAPAATEARAGASEPDADGWCDVTVALESVDVAHDELLRLAGHVEVIDPPELRDRLAATGAALARQHRAEVGSLPSPR